MTEVYNDIVFKVIELTEKYHFSIKQNIYRETLRQLLSIFGNVYYLDGNGSRVKVKCTTGKPDRPTGKDANEDNLVLPYITITETGSQESDERRKINSLLVNEKIWDDKENRAKRVLSLAPRAINITYQINIWAKYNADLDQIRYFIFSLFNPSLDIRTKFSDHTKAFVKNEEDISNAQAADTTDRLVQKTITISVETYLPSPKFLFTNTGEVKSFNAEVVLKDTRQDATEQVTDIGLGGDIIENDGGSGGGGGEGGITGPLTLSGSLDDVNLSSVSFGDILLWNGDYWVASAIADVIGGENLNHQVLTNRLVADAHPQYASSSVSAYAFGLSSTLGSHIGSASVHFTSGSLSGAYVLTSTNSNLSSLVSDIQTSTISLSSYIAANESSWSSAGATYLSSLLDVDPNSFPAANKYSVIYNSSTDLFEVRQLQFNDLSDYVFTGLLSDNWVLAYTSIVPAGFTARPLSDLVQLDTLNDVDVPSPALNDILQYTDDGSSYQWRNLPASSLVSSIEASTITISSTLESHLASAVHWELSTLNTNYLNASGDSANAGFYLSSVSATDISATNYYNLPSSTIVWEQAQDLVLLVKSNVTISKGTPVTIVSGTGSNSDIPLVEILSSVNNHIPEAYGLSNHVAGLAKEEIQAGGTGYIIVEGLLKGYDTVTPGWNSGDFLYVSSNGQLSNQRPPAPYESHPVGIVIRTQQNNGSILVKIENSPELNDIVGFNLSQTILDGDLITYDLTTSTFVNKQSINVSGAIKGGSVSAATVSATNYLNLPVSSLSGLADTNITTGNIFQYASLVWDGSRWTPSAVAGGGGGTTDHQALTLASRLNADAHPQYASSSVSAQIQSVSAYASGVSSIVSSHINDSTIHFTSGSLSGYYAGSAWTDSRYVLTSTNNELSSLVNNIQTSSNNLSGVVGAHIGSAVHWELSTLNANYLNASGDSASALFYLSSVSANRFLIASSTATTTPVSGTLLSTHTAPLIRIGTTTGGEFFRLTNNNDRGTLHIGFQSGFSNNTTTANNNTSLGYNTAVNNVTGTNNTAIGFQALNSNTSLNNTALGAAALQNNTSGADNTAIGVESLYNAPGARNIAVGYRAGYGLSGLGSLAPINNIIIGVSSNAVAPITYSNTIVIGSGTSSTADNQTIIGHPQTSSTILRGTVSSTSLISISISGTNISGAIVSATTVSAGTLHLGGSDGYLINNNGSIIISALNGTVRFPQGFELTGTISGATVSATTYLNLPTSSLSGLADTQIVNPTQGQSLVWNGTKWQPSSVAGGTGSTNAAGSNTEIQFRGTGGVFSSVNTFYYSPTANSVDITNGTNLYVDSENGGKIYGSLQGQTVSATTYLNLPSGTAAWNASKIQGVNISSTAPDLSAVFVYNGSGWTPGYSIFISSTPPDNGFGGNGDLYFEYGTNTYVLSSTNLNLSTTVSNHISSAVHWDLATLNANYVNASGDSVTAANFEFGNISAISVSAGSYKNIPSGTALWNANKLQGYNISSTTPDLSSVLVYDGNGWAPAYSIFISSTAPNNSLGSEGDLYFQYGDDIAVSAYIISATNYLNLPTSSLSGLLDTSVTVGNIGTGKSLVWNGSKWIPSSVGGGGATPFGGISNPPHEFQFYKDGGLSSTSGFIYHPTLFGGRLVVSSPLAGLNVYGSVFSTFVEGNTFRVYGYDAAQDIIISPASSLSASKFEIQSLSATTISATTYQNLPSGSPVWNALSLSGYNIDYSIGAPSEGNLLLYTDFGVGLIPKAWRPVPPDIYGNIGSYFNANKIQSVNVSSTAPTTNNVLIYDGGGWVPSSAIALNSISATTYQNLPVSSHSQLLNLNANDHPQYVLTSVNSTLSSVVNSHITDSTIHFTSGSLSGYYAGSAWVNSNYSPTSHNHSFSALSGLSDVQIPPNPANDNVLTWSSTAPGGGKWVSKAFAAAAAKNLYELEDVDPATVPPALDPFNSDSILRWNPTGGPSNLGIWEGIGAAAWFGNVESSITHNNIGGLETGDPHKQYALKSLSSTAYWNANKLQGVNISSTAPTTNQALVYDGNGWIPSSLPAGGSTTPGGSNGNVQFNNNGVFSGVNAFNWNAVNNDVEVETLSATNISAINYFNLPSQIIAASAAMLGVATNVTSPGALIFSKSITNIAAGDIIDVEINGTYTNNSGGTVTVTGVYQLGTFSSTIADGTTIAASPTNLATFNIKASFTVAATNSCGMTVYQNRNTPAAAGTQASIATTTNRYVFNTGSVNLTGSQTFNFRIISTGTATQTFTLHNYKITKIKSL